jgi:hypothetical protein
MVNKIKKKGGSHTDEHQPLTGAGLEGSLPQKKKSKTGAAAGLVIHHNDEAKNAGMGIHGPSLPSQRDEGAREGLPSQAMPPVQKVYSRRKRAEEAPGLQSEDQEEKQHTTGLHPSTFLHEAPANGLGKKRKRQGRLRGGSQGDAAGRSSLPGSLHMREAAAAALPASNNSHQNGGWEAGHSTREMIKPPNSHGHGGRAGHNGMGKPAVDAVLRVPDGGDAGDSSSDESVGRAGTFAPRNASAGVGKAEAWAKPPERRSPRKPPVATANGSIASQAHAQAAGPSTQDQGLGVSAPARLPGGATSTENSTLDAGARRPDGQAPGSGNAALGAGARLRTGAPGGEGVQRGEAGEGGEGSEEDARGLEGRGSKGVPATGQATRGGDGGMPLPKARAPQWGSQGHGITRLCACLLSYHSYRPDRLSNPVVRYSRSSIDSKSVISVSSNNGRSKSDYNKVAL